MDEDRRQVMTIDHMNYDIVS